MREDDATAVRAIYRAGTDTGEASFRFVAPSWDQFSSSRRPDHRFVAVDGGAVLGWIAVSSTSSQPCYAAVVGHSVDIAAAARSRGSARGCWRP
jgi:phosphinothricin acetyltransferase